MLALTTVLVGASFAIDVAAIVAGLYLRRQSRRIRKAFNVPR